MSVHGRRVVCEPATISRRFTAHVRRRPLIELSRQRWDTDLLWRPMVPVLCVAFAAVPA
jgi:hypothetical protein